MTHSSPPSSKLLALSFVFLFAAAGCSRASEGEQAGADGAAQDPAAASAPAEAPQGQAAPGQGAPQAAPDTTPLAPEKLPAVVAKVNDKEIKKDELLEAADELGGQLSQQMGGAEPPRTADFYRQVLDGMIARVLLEQEAKAQGITVTDEEVKTQLGTLRQRFPTEEAYKQALAEQGVTEEELIKEGRDMLAVQKLVETKIVSEVKVTDEAAQAFYQENQARMQQPEQAHLRHILVKVDQGASAEDKQKAKAEADALHARVKKGEDFAALAREHSDDPGSKEQGGDLNWISPGQTVEPFDKAAFALKPNEVSGVVESQFGYHIIQLLERKEASTIPFEQVKERINGFLKQQQSQQAVQARIQALRAKAKVETFI